MHKMRRGNYFLTWSSSCTYSKSKIWDCWFTQFWFFIKGFGTSFSTTFYVWFFKNNVSHVMFYKLTKLSDCLFFLKYWTIMCIVIVSFPVVDGMNFQINDSFLYGHFPAWPKKSGRVFRYLKMKRVFKERLLKCAFKRDTWLENNNYLDS